MTTPDSPPDKLVAFLVGTPLFSGVDKADLSEIATRLKPIELPAGAVLLSEGDAADAAFVVVNGRLRAFIKRDGSEQVVGEFGRGEVVGEMGLLNDEPRSATVRAVRDSFLLKFPKSEFNEFIERHPRALFAITRLVIGRLQRSLRHGAKPSAVRTVAVVPAGGGSDLLVFSERLAKALGEHGSTMLINRERLSSQLRHRDAISHVGERLLINRQQLASQFLEAPDPVSLGSELDADTTQWLHNLESSQDFVIYQSDPGPSRWTDRCLRQADRILLVSRAGARPALGPIEEGMVQKALLRSSLRVAARKDLVLLRNNRVAHAQDTMRWLEVRPDIRHHHVSLDSSADFERLARVIADRQVGLVFSGGGARGVAHIGVLQALEECKIPVDLVGGSSFGAIMAAGPALGWSAQRLRERVKQTLVEPGSVVDYTVPLTALTTGRKATTRIRNAFGDAYIEDLWLPYFCLSSNLTRGGVVQHTRGPLWRAIRASVALPGIFPPMRSADDEVLADGGIMNNLPVDVMRSFCDGGKVFAVNVRGENRMPARELSDIGVVSGWGLLARRLNPFARRAAVPGIVEVILRAVDTGNAASMHELEKEADLCFHPPVAEFGLLQFDAYEDLIEVGYRHAMERLKAFSMTPR